MGLRGPAKKNAEEQDRRGNPGKRKLDIEEKNLTDTRCGVSLFMISRPDWLTKEAVEQWNSLVPKLIAANMMTALDVELVAKYCQCIGIAIAAERVLQKGLTIKNSNRTVSIRPEVKIAEAQWKQAAKLAEVIGLTPKSRKSMGIALRKPKEKDADTARKDRIRGK